MVKSSIVDILIGSSTVCAPACNLTLGLESRLNNHLKSSHMGNIKNGKAADVMKEWRSGRGGA